MHFNHRRRRGGIYNPNVQKRNTGLHHKTVLNEFISKHPSTIVAEPDLKAFDNFEYNKMVNSDKYRNAMKIRDTKAKDANRFKAVESQGRDPYFGQKNPTSEFPKVSNVAQSVNTNKMRIPQKNPDISVAKTPFGTRVKNNLVKGVSGIKNFGSKIFGKIKSVFGRGRVNKRRRRRHF